MTANRETGPRRQTVTRYIIRPHQMRWQIMLGGKRQATCDRYSEAVREAIKLAQQGAGAGRSAQVLMQVIGTEPQVIWNSPD